MTTDPSLQTMTRDNKDYAKFSKEQLWANNEKDKNKFYAKQQVYQNVSLNIMKDNVPVHVKDDKKYMWAQDRQGKQVELEIDYDTVCKTNPVTGEVTVNKHGEKFKVGY